MFHSTSLSPLEQIVLTETTLEMGVEDVKTTLETGGEDVKSTLETSGEDFKFRRGKILSDLEDMFYF